MPPCFRTHGSTIVFNNIGLLAEIFKFNFAKKSNFKTGGLGLWEYHEMILSTELFLYHASHTKDGIRPKAYRSIALRRSLAHCFLAKI